MNLLDMARYGLNALRHRSIRSWLTVLGIVVGITAIVVLVGLVQGLKDEIVGELKGFGTTTLIIIPSNLEGGNGGAMSGSSFMPSSGKLYMKDYERVKRLPDIEYITPVISGRTYAQHKDSIASVSIYGIYPEVFSHTTTLEIESGRYLSDSDHRAAVLGSDIADGTFEEDVAAGASIYIGDEKYRVAGVLKKTGSSFSNTDSVTYIPFEEAKSLFANILSTDEINAIRMTLKEGSDMEAAAEEVEDIMLASHRVSDYDKDFTVVSPKFINDQVDSVTGVLSLFLGAIAGISLAVGGVGIANTMFMSVMERRREIGVLKAIGARENDIMMLFLVESSMIGAAGGALGLLMAFLIALLLGVFDVTVSISPFVAIGAVIFSAAVGIGFGTVPARNAAKLDPVEALRYE